MEQLTFSKVKKGNVNFKSIGTPVGVTGQTPVFSLTKDGETVKYSTDGVNYEILGGGGALIFNNVAVAVADFVSDTTYADYPYRAAVALTGVALTMIANVVFDITDATSGNYAPLSDTYAGGTYIYAKEVPAAAITIPTIYVLSEAASGGVSGNAWTNRGLWVANVQYNSYDIVYDNAGCFLCVADIASATAPESDTTNWSAVYKTVTPSNPLPVGGVPNAALLKNSVNNYDAKWGLVPLLVTNTEMLNALTDGGYADLQVVTPEDDDGYEIGHLYQFHIISDVYSWTDITPAGGAIGSKISGSLPTSGWDTINYTLWKGKKTLYKGSYNSFGILKSGLYSVLINDSTKLFYLRKALKGYVEPTTFSSFPRLPEYDDSSSGICYGSTDYRVYINSNDNILIRIWDYASAIDIYEIATDAFSDYTYTIYKTAIKTNSYANMQLNSADTVTAYSKTDGSIVVEMDAVPTTEIPYTLQVIETSNEGAFLIDNKYVPTKTSELTNDSGFLTAQTQANWNETDTTSPAYIQNKPTIPTKTSELTNDTGYITSSLVEVSTAGDVTQTLSPNTFYNFTGALTNLTLSFGTTINGIVNEYMGQFLTGSTVPTITFPATVSWVGGSLAFVANSTYQFSIVNNVGIMVKL